MNKWKAENIKGKVQKIKHPKIPITQKMAPAHLQAMGWSRKAAKNIEEETHHLKVSKVMIAIAIKRRAMIEEDLHGIVIILEKESLKILETEVKEEERIVKVTDIIKESIQDLGLGPTREDLQIGLDRFILQIRHQGITIEKVDLAISLVFQRLYLKNLSLIQKIQIQKLMKMLNRKK